MTAAPLNNAAAKSIATQQAAQVLIAEYKAAYEAGNMKSAPEVTYLRGWFIISDRYGTIRRRRDAFARMRDTLLERAAS